MVQALTSTAVLARNQERVHDHAAYEAASRILQVAVSVVGMIFLLPVMAVLAAAIKAASRGPVLYRGARVGKGERIFTIYKFRTLHVGAEQKIGSRLLRNDDPFYHRLGKFLRRAKLDEIPQLLNVIKGDMNLVGPRPTRLVFLDESRKTVPGYSGRFAVRPGMTGLAQLRGGYYTTIANKLRYDLIYVRRRSLWLDFVILTMTFVKLVQKWITKASLLCLIVLFVSFVPAGVSRLFLLRVLGVQFNPIIPVLLAAGAYLALSTGKSNRWLISHSAIDAPMVAFVLISLFAAPFSASPVTALRGLLYLCITGFFFAFVMVNLRPDVQFVKQAGQVVGLAAGGVAMMGLVGRLGAGLGLLDHPIRTVATLGSPMGLAAYLALGFPFVLCEYLEAKSRTTKLAWVTVLTAITAAVFTAGSRLGVPALLVSAGVLLVKTGKLRMRDALLGGGACLLMLATVGGQRFSPAAVATDLYAAATGAVRSIQESSFQQLLIGYGTKTIRSSAAAGAPWWRQGVPQSTYLTLLLENGVAGFCLMTWLAALVVREIAVTARNQAASVRMRLWSLAAAICGLGVAAISFDVFYNIATQVVFWGIVGLALGLSVRCGGKDHGAMLVMRFGH